MIAQYGVSLEGDDGSDVSCGSELYTSLTDGMSTDSSSDKVNLASKVALIEFN